jgi:hypothetical protein
MYKKSPRGSRYINAVIAFLLLLLLLLLLLGKFKYYTQEMFGAMGAIRGWLRCLSICFNHQHARSASTEEVATT